MPAVQVALREMAKGKAQKANDVMAYIVTGDGSKPDQNAAQRAYTPQDVMAPNSGLTPGMPRTLLVLCSRILTFLDIEWYLYKQLLPPIERLCAPIHGTDAVRIAECLGLDTRKYQIVNTSNQQQEEIFPLESQVEDAVRFQDAARLSIRCRFCKQAFRFDGLAQNLEVCNANGLTCPNEGCGRTLSTISIVAQLESQIRQQTSRYYAGWLICDDQACGNRTRQMSVYGHRCLGPKGHGHGCLGRMSYEYTEKMLYNQLLYFQSLWDVDKAKAKAKGEYKERIFALAEHNRERFQTLKAVVDSYLDKCGRQWVAMDSLFGFALKVA